MNIEPDTTSAGEPEGGWVHAPTLMDSDKLTVTLCKYSGLPVEPAAACPDREERRHPDVDCINVYAQVYALLTGELPLGVALTRAEAVTSSGAGEPTIREPQ